MFEPASFEPEVGGLGFRILGFRFRVSGLGFWSSGLGFRILDF